MGDIINWISNNWIDLLAVWGAVCIIIDFLTGLTKSPKDDEWWAKIKKAIQSVINLNPFTKKK
jgi:hypothetical protein